MEPLVTANSPVQQCCDNDDAKNWTCVIHVTSGDGEHGREGYPSDNVYQVCECDEIDGDTVAAEFKHAIINMLSMDLS